MFALDLEGTPGDLAMVLIGAVLLFHDLEMSIERVEFTAAITNGSFPSSSWDISPPSM